MLSFYVKCLQMFQEKFNKPCGCINRAYRLILIDIQMPVMDGIESSNNITKIIKNKYDSDSIYQRRMRLKWNNKNS